MNLLYSSLDRRIGENQDQFDNRISKMLPFVSGTAYFDLRNYDPHTGEFNVYIEWDESVNGRLAYRLPSGGYYVKATTGQACEFHCLTQGIPVYMKIVSRQGNLYAYRTYTMFMGRVFSVEFGGGQLIPFEDRYEELGCAAAPRQDGSKTVGSQRLAGSQRFAGSQRWHEFEFEYEYGTGSWRYYRLGSQRFLWTGSGLRQIMGSGLRYITGSRGYVGSQRYIDGYVQNMYLPGDNSQFMINGFPESWQLINTRQRPVKRIGGNDRFGYGLDLI